MSAPHVRRAAAADARALSALGRLTFTQTFAHLYPPEDLAAYLDEAHGAERYGDWLADPAYGLWVVESAGALIGYAMAGPCHLPHPEVTSRRFVLVPLLELEPALTLPDGSSLAAALAALGDGQAVHLAGPPLEV